MRSELQGTTVLTKVPAPQSSGSRFVAVALAIALGVGVRASVVLSRPGPGEVPDSLGSSIVQYLLAFFPYLLALFLLVLPNFPRKCLASGIALVSSTLYLLGCIIVLVLGGVFYWGGHPLLWLFILSHVLVAAASAPARKSPVDLGLGVAIVAGYIAIGAAATRLEDMKREKADSVRALAMESQKAEGIEAIKDLAWCAIQYKTATGLGYPADLGALASFAGCSRGRIAIELPDYLLSYSPLAQSTDKVTQFTASVVPRDSQSMILNSYFSDESGIVLKQPPGSYKDVLSLGDNPFPVLRYLFWHLKIFASGRPQLGYPSNLQDLPRPWLSTGLHRATTPKGNSLLTESGDYQILYRAATSSPPVPSFEIEVRCENYAKRCVRNYLVTDTGEVHATSEDRAAALDDPLATKVEMRGELECAAPCESVQP